MSSSSMLMTFNDQAANPSRTTLLALLDGLASGVVVIDAAGKLLFYNQVAATLLRMDETNSSKTLNLHDTGLEDFVTRERLLAKALNKEQVDKLEFDVPGNDARLLSVSARPFDADGVRGALLLLRDITQRREAGEDSHIELEHVAWVASHDLREPIRTIRSFSEIISEDATELNEDSRRHLGFITSAAERMQSLVEGLVGYLRIGDTKFDKVETTALVAEVVEDLQSTNDITDANLHLGRLHDVRGDRTQIRQLFENLVTNASAFRAKDRPLEISIESTDTSATQVAFAVRDNGIGIEQQHFDSIFQLTRRLHSRDVYTGAGIGLAVCSRIVAHHGGRIWVESTVGTGSTFYFTLSKHAPLSQSHLAAT